MKNSLRNARCGVQYLLLVAEGRKFWDCTKCIMGCLGEELKVWRGRHQSGLGRNKCMKTEGKEDKTEQSVANRLLVHT